MKIGCHPLSHQKLGDARWQTIKNCLLLPAAILEIASDLVRLALSHYLNIFHAYPDE
jgi:hypothetical protein